MPPLPALVVAFTLLVTPALLAIPVVRVGGGPWERLGGLLALLGLLLMLVPVAPWPWVGLSTRWIVLGGGLACLLVGTWRLARTGLGRPTPTGILSLVISALLGGGFGWLGIQALRGRAVPSPPVALQFPLRSASSEGGRFVVGNGGSTAVLNGHARVAAQRYALDIEALGPRGWRATGLYPKERDAYAIWDARVVAPCAGEVLSATDGLPDLPPGETDVVNLAGNHVVLSCGDVTVLLAHFREGTVAVTAGEHVVAGQDLGRVGNSGNTSEPHLHVHAVRGRPSDFETLAFTGEAVPMSFDGRFLVRHDVVATE